MRRRLLYALAALMLAAFVAFVWPTRWRYIDTRDGLVRVDRISGRAEQLTPTGWEQLSADRLLDSLVKKSWEDH